MQHAGSRAVSRNTRIETGPNGLVIVKDASGEADVERLHREARMLTLAQHPGVVELVSFADLTPQDGSAGPRAELQVVHVGSHTLATLPLRNVAHASGLIAALAETVADLHSIGIVHRGLRPGAVLIDREGRPVLTGFADAALVGTPADAANPDGPNVRPSDDLPALAALLQKIIGAGTDPDPIPERRMARRSKSRAYTRRALLNLADQATADDPSLRPSARSFATAIRAVEPNALFVPPADLPSGPSRIHARQVGQPIEGHDDSPPAPAETKPTDPRPVTEPGNTPASETVHRGASDALPPLPRRRTKADETVPPPSAVSTSARSTPARPSGSDHRDHVPTRSHAPRARRVDSRRGLPVAAAMIGLAALTFGLLSSWHGERPNLAEASPPGSADLASTMGMIDPTTTAPPLRDATSATGLGPPSTAASTSPTAPPPSASTTVSPCPTVSAPPEPATAAGTCARSHPLADGVLAAGGKRFKIGEPDDEVLVGDWRCSGEPVPALVRPSTGDVYVFTAWATPGADVTARSLGNRGAGTHLETGSSLTEGGCPVLVSRTADGPVREIDATVTGGSR